MPQIYYDEFSRLPKDKMAQKMEDMTFAYNETRVPKKHYKKLLDMAQEEIIESSVELNLIDTYYRTIEQLQKANPKWLFQALLCIDKGIKPNTIKPDEYQALELTWQKFNDDKKAKSLDKQWLDYFESIKVNGAFYSLTEREDD